MHFNSRLPVLDYDGMPTIEDTGKHLSLGVAAIRALNIPDAGDSAEIKVRRFAISLKINTALHEGGVTELTVDEAADIKVCVGKYFGPLVVGRIFEAIEGKLSLPIGERATPYANGGSSVGNSNSPN